MTDVYYGGLFVVTANGDFYERGENGWSLRNNIFAGAPTNAKPESWGSVKARYR